MPKNEGQFPNEAESEYALRLLDRTKSGNCTKQEQECVADIMTRFVVAAGAGTGPSYATCRQILTKDWKAPKK